MEKEKLDSIAQRESYRLVAKDLAKRHFFEISDHIESVMVSVMMARDGVYKGGGFVQAILDNNLDEACSRADGECVNYLRLFSLVKRFGYIIKF